MKIGVQSGGIFDKNSLDEGFKTLRDTGFDCVDINIDHFYSYGDIVKGNPDTFLQGDESELRALANECKAAADKYGISFSQAHGPFPFYVINEDGNKYVMHATKQCLKFCAWIGCPYLIVHPCFLGYDDKLTAEEEWKINMERYGELIPLAKELHVGICLENMFAGHNGKIYQAICTDMHEAARYIDALNELAGEEIFSFCFDVGHALLAGLELPAAFRVLGKRVKTLHIHDNNGASDQHLFPYMGVADWNRFTQGLKAIGYNGVLSFETFNAMNVYDPALRKDALKLLSACGRMFASRIEG